MSNDPNRKAAFADLLHARSRTLKQGEPVPPPIVPSAVFRLSGSTEADFQYGRFSNPTWEALEEELSILEDAPALIFPSGMAAVAASLVPLVKAGETVLVPSDGYYTTRLLVREFLEPLGMTVREVATRDMVRADLGGVSLVFVETPSNPGLDVCDIAALSARTKIAGARLVADNTTATPLLQRPLELGADITLSSDTKAISGHSDVLLGHVATNDPDLLARMKLWRKVSGSIPGPFEAWLVRRGLETLEVRLERMCSSAAEIAARLREHPAVQAIRFPGLPGDPSFEIAKQQMARPGHMISLTLASEAQAETFLSECRLISETTSFGGVLTAGERRARWGDAVAPGFVRLSVGCEPLEPLWDAISDALDTALTDAPD